jgi:hypothetical protein
MWHSAAYDRLAVTFIPCIGGERGGGSGGERGGSRLEQRETRWLAARGAPYGGGMPPTAHLGVQAIRHRGSLAEALGAEIEAKSTARIVADGFTVGVTNPKVMIFFAAMLPQFVDRQAGNVPLQIVLLGAIFAGIALFSDSTWALAAGTVRAWLSKSPRRLALIGGAGGLAMIGIGTSLALTGRND